MFLFHLFSFLSNDFICLVWSFYIFVSSSVALIRIRQFSLFFSNLYLYVEIEIFQQFLENDDNNDNNNNNDDDNDNNNHNNNDNNDNDNNDNNNSNNNNDDNNNNIETKALSIFHENN